MEDYMIDENLLRDVKEPSAMPTPYPERYSNAKNKTNDDTNNPSKRKQYYSTAMTNQQNAPIHPIVNPSSNQLKKEMGDLESKYFNLMKLFEKSEKKLKDTTEESKRLKLSNDSMLKEFSLLQKTIERINSEKSSLLTQFEDSKAYTRKLESRVVSGAKNQNLIEINNKLRSEIDDLNNKISSAGQNQDGLILENGCLTKKIESMEHALAVKAKELQLNNPEALMSYAETMERNAKATNDLARMHRENVQLKKLIKEQNAKIEELLFAKEHLTGLLAQKEGSEKEDKEELESIEEHNKQLTAEKTKMMEYIEHMERELAERCDELNGYAGRVDQLQMELEQKDNDEAEREKLVSAFQEYKKENGALKETVQRLEQRIEEMEKDKEALIKDTGDRMRQFKASIEEYQKESEEYHKGFNTKQEEIKKYQCEIASLQQERDKFKKCLNDFVNSNGNIIPQAAMTKVKENKGNLNFKSINIQDNFGYQSNLSATNTTTLDLVRKEKDKNKEILNEIRKLQEKSRG